MIKSKNVIERMKSLEGNGVTVLKNVLNTDEVENLKRIYRDIKIAKPDRTKSRAILVDRKNEITTLKEEDFHEVDRIIKSKLNLLPFKYESMNFYKIQNPYHLHSDTGKNNRISYIQGVIPLEIVPAVEAKTVIFDQRVYFSSEYIFPNVGKNPDYEPFNNIGTWDPSIYEGWSDEYKITEEQAKEIWYDKWEYWIERHKGFSIKYVYKWNIGDILLFERSLLHAASMIKEAGLDYKSGLLFLTYIDQ